METVKLEFNDSDLSVVVYRTIEIFDIIKDVKLKLLGRVINIDEKKILSILLAIIGTENRIGNIINKSSIDYGIEVYSKELAREQYNYIYDNYFSKLLNSDRTLEDIFSKIICDSFILELNKEKGISQDYFANVIKKSKENIKVKTYIKNS